jgi:hypothetical protein
MDQSMTQNEDNDLRYVLINATNIIKVIDDQIKEYETMIDLAEPSDNDTNIRKEYNFRINECKHIKTKFMQLINSTGLKRDGSTF